MRALSPSDESLAWGVVDNGGAVLGTAGDAGVGLAYVGSIHHPFPDFGSGSPLDDADRTARALLERYRRFGLEFLDPICGHAAVVIVEPGAGRVVLARAHGSATRLFYRRAGDELSFSTKLADMVALAGDSAALDRSLEDFLLGYEFLPGGRTPFQGVLQLLPGRLLEFRRGEVFERALSPVPVWGERYAAVDFRDEPQVIEALYSAFEAAIDDQLPSDPKVGVLLGGLDSALIAARLAARGKEVHTFSFQYDDGSYNQAFVEELSARYGTHHHWVPITPRVMEEGLTRYAQRFNQVVGQAHYVIASAEVCRAARQAGLRHCLTGDGCDGLFLGYPTVHFRAKLIKSLSRVAPLLEKPLDAVTGSEFLEKRIGHPYRIARNVGRVLKRPMPARGHVAACTLDGDALRFLRKDAPPQERDPEAILLDLAKGLEHVGDIRLAYFGKGRVGLNSAKLDGASTFGGVTLNSPYLHPGMAMVAQAIPDELSRPDRKTKSRATGKYAFMQMVEQKRLLPSEMIYQRKRSPVTSPVDHWYWGSLRSFMLARLEKLPFEVDRDYVESLVTPKLPELLFRTQVGISHFATQAICLLVTYASYAELVSKAKAEAPRAARRDAMDETQ